MTVRTRAAGHYAEVRLGSAAALECVWETGPDEVCGEPATDRITATFNTTTSVLSDLTHTVEVHDEPVCREHRTRAQALAVKELRDSSLWSLFEATPIDWPKARAAARCENDHDTAHPTNRAARRRAQRPGRR